MFYMTAVCMCMHWGQENKFDLFTIKKSNKTPETMFLSIAQKNPEEISEKIRI